MLEIFKDATAETLVEIAEEKKIRGTHELFLLFALGSQFDHLIKQMLEKIGVFCLVADPASVTAEDVKKLAPKGIILSGGPASVYVKPPPFVSTIFDLRIPVLGICLGFQLWARHLGIPVVATDKKEFGVHTAFIHYSTFLFEGCGGEMNVLQSHGDRIDRDAKIRITASTNHALVAAGEYKHLYGVQFHPEVSDTEHGEQIFKNFCFRICDAKDQLPARDLTSQKIAALQNQMGEDDRVILALSGGSDSSVAAYLLKKVLGRNAKNTRAIYIQGLDRIDDRKHVEKYFGNQSWIELKIVDATIVFLKALKDKITMQEKRLAMRDAYTEILEREIRTFNASWIMQGTLYTDLSESGRGYDTGAKKAVIKHHHNVGNEFSIRESIPLADCVKDTARSIGRAIGVPQELLIRHPFPGPGLAIKIEGEVTEEKLRIARTADQIFIEELRSRELYETVWQAGVVITQSVTTCTKGDDAATGLVAALWAVWSVNGFTAQAAELPWDFIKYVSGRITNEISEIGAVVYRTSGKPPSTIEWG